VLLVVAHPLDNAFAKAAAARIRATLERRGIEVDLCREARFRLSAMVV
jgi:putative NADPH-quinone reductase